MPAGSGAHVHQVVRGIEQVLVVFHAEDGVPGIPQTENGCQEKGHFIEVKAAGGFVQNEQGPFPVFRQFPGRGFGQFRSYFYALGFSAGKGVRPAVEIEVSQPYVLHAFQDGGGSGQGGKEFRRFVHGQGQRLGNGFPFPGDFQRFPVVALPLAGVAGHCHVSQKVHVHFNHARSLATFTAASANVGGKARRRISPLLGKGELCVKGAQHLEQAGSGGRCGARRFADGRLGDDDEAVEVFRSLHAERNTLFPGEVLPDCGDEAVPDKGGFS